MKDGSTKENSGSLEQRGGCRGPEPTWYLDSIGDSYHIGYRETICEICEN
jgi:hypothetical protein